MSKRFKGKRCVYCSERPSTAPDHVFAREFFLPEHRAHLPQVPACDKCNREKATLEHYVSALLPFGGRHSVAGRNLAEMVPKRLAKNARLHRTFREGMGHLWAMESGVVVPVSTVPVQSDQLMRLFEFVARGLAAFHWQLVLNPRTQVHALALTPAGEARFDRMFAIPSNALVLNSLGSGTFSYEGAQDSTMPEATAWRVRVYGGATFADPRLPGHVSRSFGVLTIPA